MQEFFYPVLSKEPKLLYEDNHVLAVFKPSGWLVQGDSTGDKTLLDWARAYLKQKYSKPGNVYLGLVHRLDRLTAGVMIFAKTSKAAGRLSKEFRERSVRKHYWAWVEGEISPPSGKLQHWIRNGEEKVEVFQYETPDSKSAELFFTRIGAEGKVSLLNVELKTGRKHQIRAQLAAQGFPVLGDKKYGSSQPFPPGGIGLVSHRLEISHPVSKEFLKIAIDPSGLLKNV